jgi:hypothetical protein
MLYTCHSLLTDAVQANEDASRVAVEELQLRLKEAQEAAETHEKQCAKLEQQLRESLQDLWSLS